MERETILTTFPGNVVVREWLMHALDYFETRLFVGDKTKFWQSLPLRKQDASTICSKMAFHTARTKSSASFTARNITESAREWQI
jgi:hypothetical protein